MNKKYITPAIIVCKAKVGSMMLNLSVVDNKDDNGDGQVLSKKNDVWLYYLDDEDED